MKFLKQITDFVKGVSKKFNDFYDGTIQKFEKNKKAKEQKTTVSLFSKIFTFSYGALIVALLIFVYIFLATTVEFIKPISFKVDMSTYDYTLDEFVAFLDETGYMDASLPRQNVGVDGVSEMRKYGDTYVLYWDRDTLSESELAEWESMKNIGNMRLPDDTLIVVYGCFGVSYKEKAPDAEEETYKVLESFPMKFSGNHGGPTVWDYTFDQFWEYMETKGHFVGDRKVMSTIGTENWIVNGIDVIWWDVENLVEGTEPYDYWNQLQTDGYIMFGGAAYVVQTNGPFAIKANSYPGETKKLYEDFAMFPKGYTPSVSE